MRYVGDEIKTDVLDYNPPPLTRLPADRPILFFEKKL